MDEAMTPTRERIVGLVDAVSRAAAHEISCPACDWEVAERKHKEARAALLAAVDELIAERDALTALLFDHGIMVTAGGYEYENNSPLSPKPCTWAKTIQDAQRYRFLREFSSWPSANDAARATRFDQRGDLIFLSGDKLDAAIDAARGSE